mmetsp:Transcript_60331/g.159871  ORF Transcript_60331/g.159871 Transcript_60331/m.159871 type:complete len:101 (+) Transcript_60331:32-334(+)
MSPCLCAWHAEKDDEPENVRGMTHAPKVRTAGGCDQRRGDLRRVVCAGVCAGVCGHRARITGLLQPVGPPQTSGPTLSTGSGTPSAMPAGSDGAGGGGGV